MNNIESWAINYCSDKGISYEELVKKALEYYKVYNERIEYYNFMNSSEFKAIIKNLYVLINKYEDPWNLTVLKKCPKDEYANFFSMSNCRILELSKEEEPYAFIVLSFENDENGNYVFLHSIDFFKEEYKANYRYVERKIEGYSKKNGILYLDRCVRNASEDDIKKNGYFNMFENLNCKINLEGFKVHGGYNFLKKNYIEDGFVKSYKIKPERFDLKSNEAYQIGDYAFIRIKRVQDKGYIRIYLSKGKEQDNQYLKIYYGRCLDFCCSMGLKEIYTSFIKEHTMILDTLAPYEVLGNVSWIRKPL